MLEENDKENEIQSHEKWLKNKMVNVHLKTRSQRMTHQADEIYKI